MNSALMTLFLRLAAWGIPVAALILIGSYRLEGLVRRHESDIYTTILLYLAVGLLGLALLRGAGVVFRWAQRRRVRLGVSWVSLCLALFVADLSLRYVDGRYSSHSERIGEGFFIPVHPPAGAWGEGGREFGLDTLLDSRRNNHFFKRTVEYSYPLSYNEEGLRDRSHPVEKKEGETRILCLGDSFTEGVGAPYASAWPQQLEKILRRYKSTVRVMNGGVGGGDPFYAYRLLKTRLLKYKPDVIVVALHSSDLDDYEQKGGLERFVLGAVRPSTAPWWQPLYGCSFVVRHVAHDLLGYNGALQPQNAVLEEYTEAKEAIHGVLELFRKLALQAKFKLLVAFLPEKTEVNRGQMKLAGMVVRMGKKREIDVVDLLTYFKREVEGAPAKVDAYFWQKDLHCTPKGYAVVARGVADRIQQLGWVQ